VVRLSPVASRIHGFTYRIRQAGGTRSAAIRDGGSDGEHARLINSDSDLLPPT
jgi:hypothetical protein